MLDAALAHAPALSLQAGRHGRTEGPPGLVIQEQTGRQIVGIAARDGRTVAVVEAVRQRWGVALPLVPRVAGDGAVAFAWSGAGQWTAHAPGEGGGMALEAALGEALTGLAAVTGQGDGRVVLRVWGPAVRPVLATGIGIDLHPRAFAAGDTAVTMAHHIGVQIRQLDDTPRYELIAFRSFADSLAGWLLEAGAPHGVELLGPSPLQES